MSLSFLRALRLSAAAGRAAGTHDHVHPPGPPAGGRRFAECPGAASPTPAKRPPTWSLSNWPVAVEGPGDRAGTADSGDGVRWVARQGRDGQLQRSAAGRRPRRRAAGDHQIHVGVGCRVAGELHRARRRGREEELRGPQVRAADAAGRHRRDPRRPVRGEHPAERRPGAAGQGGRQQHRFAGPGDHLRPDPADGRGRRSTRRCASTTSRSAPRRRV